MSGIEEVRLLGWGSEVTKHAVGDSLCGVREASAQNLKENSMMTQKPCSRNEKNKDMPWWIELLEKDQELK